MDSNGFQMLLDRFGSEIHAVSSAGGPNDHVAAPDSHVEAAPA